MKNSKLLKRAMLPMGVAAACAEPIAAMAAKPKAVDAQQRPNVVFIIADDLGWNDLGCMGSTFHETPYLDSLAKQGVLFTNAYATCQVSSPSRASIMTGKYTTRHGVTDWIGEASGEDWRKMNRGSKLLPADYQWQLSHDEITIAEYLKEFGYKTFMAGKWHLGEEGSWPEDHGFDINIGGWSSGGPKGGYYSPWNNPKLPNVEDGENLSMRLANETAKFMREHKEGGSDEPFFVYLAYYAVHGALETSQERWSHFRDKADSMGLAQSAFIVDRTLPVRQHQDNPVYAGLLQQMDESIGVVMAALDELGYDENTMVIFTSDNGGVTSGDAFSTSMLPLRGGKGRQWEGGIREPLIIREPSGKGAGTVCDVPVIGTDFYPTILDFASLPYNKKQHVDGVSIMPLLDGGAIAERPLFWHYPHYGNQGGEPSSIIRDGDWKLIHYYEDGRDELYNLAIDISESQTLNHLYPEMIKPLKKKLDKWLKETDAILPVADPLYSPEKETTVKREWATKTLQRQETIRRNMLKPDWQPNASWWGSKVTID